MGAGFGRGKRSEEEILDLTAPALAGEGIVARWLRESLARSREAAAADALTHPVDPI
jgi:hypothetical protein